MPSVGRTLRTYVLRQTVFRGIPRTRAGRYAPAVSQLLRLLALAAACLVAHPLPASAATWEPPALVAPPSATGTTVSWSPVVAADADGDLTAAWFGDGANGFGVYAATRAAALSGQWSAPTRLGAALAPRDLRLAVNGSGQAVAGWVDAYPNLTQRIVTATRGSAGTWSAPTLLPAVEGEYTGLDLDLGADGSAAGLWATSDGSLGALTAPAGGPLSTAGAGPADAANADGGAPFDLAIDSAGRVTALYLDATGLGLLSATRTESSNWQTPQLVERWTPPSSSDFGSLEAPQLAINASGRAVAVWMRRADAGAGLQAAIRPAGGSWTTSVPLASITDQRYVVTSGVGIDAAGTVTAAWDVVGFEFQFSGDVRYWTEVRSMTAPASGTSWNPVEIRGLRKQVTFSPPADPETAPEIQLPAYAGVKVAVGAGGPVAVTWLERLGSATSLHSAVRSATSAWEPASQLATLDVGDLGDLGLVTSAVIDPAGRATTVWTDGRAVRSRTIALAALPTDPGPVQPEPTTPAPTAPEPLTPAPPLHGAGDPVPTGGLPSGGQPARGARLVVAMYLIPSRRRCPASAGGTVGEVRTTLKVTPRKIRGKLRCKVTGIISLPATMKAGANVKVLVTAKGVKRKSVVFTATA